MSVEHKVKHFSDLRAWQEERAAALLVYRITKLFPDDERFGLTNQSRRAAISIAANIAEGFGRSTVKDKQHFYITAKTSLAELQSHMMIAKDLAYVTDVEFADIERKLIVVDKLLAGLIRSAAGKGIHNT